MIDCYPNHSLQQIWNGDVFSLYRKAIRQKELPIACATCKRAIQNGEYNSVKINQYDNLKVSKFFKNKPRLIEMALSNNCNLECIMCNGTQSSSIRTNREKRPSNKSIFGQNFREELSEFIPDLQEIVFAGGEPFLNPLYYDIWEDAIRLNPKCYLSVVTNGTILNDRIKSLMERGNFKINLSLDAMTKETYESIRVNANFEETMSNMKYFGDTLARQGKKLHIPICPLRANRFELPDLVRFCNANNYSINFVNVNGAVDVAMYSMTSSELKELKNIYVHQKYRDTDEISKKNIMEFKELTRRLDRWIELAIRKECFKEYFDLKTDLVETLKKQLYQKLYETLSHKNIDNDSINKQLSQVIEIQNQLMSSLPEYYYSNHFFRKLLNLSPELYLTMIMESHMTYLQSRSEELFFYL
jgi:molybdenum cofactor biosynthesis enzyme MoaA